MKKLIGFLLLLSTCAHGQFVQKEIQRIALAHQSKKVLTPALTITWDFTLASYAQVTISGNDTLNILNVHHGDVGILNVVQGGSGGYGLVLPGVVESGKTLSSTAGNVDQLQFLYDTANGGQFYWYITAFGAYTGGSGGGESGGSGTVLTWTGKSTGVAEETNGLKYTGASGGGKVARSNETIATGNKVAFSVDGQGTGVYQKFLGLTTQTTFTGFTQLNFALYAYDGGDVYVTESGTVVGGTPKTTITNTDYLRINYNGSTILYQKSADNSTWSTFYTSTVTPSGSYYVGCDFYTNGALMHEMKKY